MANGCGAKLYKIMNTLHIKQRCIVAHVRGSAIIVTIVTKERLNEPLVDRGKKSVVFVVGETDLLAVSDTFFPRFLASLPSVWIVLVFLGLVWELWGGGWN